MDINTSLSEKEYINASLTIMLSKITIRIFLGLNLLIIISNAFMNIITAKSILPGILSPVIILSAFLAITYFSLKRAYKNNPGIKENIAYQFQENNLVIKGESFSSELTWNKIKKVTKSKKWLLIWQTNQIANAIQRNSVTEEDMNSLKEILLKHNVKNNL
ncbi:MAG: YcxB family protein [Sphingobacteriales bacterium]